MKLVYDPNFCVEISGERDSRKDLLKNVKK